MKTEPLAKKRAEIPPIGQKPTCCLADQTIRGEVEGVLRLEHISQWLKAIGSRQSQMFINESSTLRAKELLDHTEIS